MAPSLITSNPLPITCTVTPWYFWRMAKFAALFLAAGLWFGYDGLIGYPKLNKIAEAHSAFQSEVQGSFLQMEETGRLAEWIALADSKGWPTSTNGEPPTWVSFAAKHGWPEKPPKFQPSSSIRTQLTLGLAGIATALATALLAFLNRNKSLRADADSLTTPDGRRIPFSSVFQIDRRPWFSKGFARLSFTNDRGKKGKTIIDDLKFGGAHQVLERLEANFQGTIIDEAQPDEESAEAPAAAAAPPVSSAARPAV